MRKCLARIALTIHLCTLFAFSTYLFGPALYTFATDVNHYYGASVPSQPLKTGQVTSYHAGDDGDLEKGVSRSYNILTAGQYSGTTNIVINGKTHALSNNCVIDERTGLVWARYVPDADIGPGADGKLFWDQWTLAAESCTFATAGDTITAAAGTPFNTGALCVGRKITISGTVNNNGVVTVTGITTSEIIVAENLTDEGPVDVTFATLDDLAWDFRDQANANSLGGYDDWEIPNRKQLDDLVDISRDNPCINITAFPSTPSSYFWTSSTGPSSSLYAFSLYFVSGGMVDRTKNSKQYYVRLVRDN